MSVLQFTGYFRAFALSASVSVVETCASKAMFLHADGKNHIIILFKFFDNCNLNANGFGTRDQKDPSFKILTRFPVHAVDI